MGTPLVGASRDHAGVASGTLLSILCLCRPCPRNGARRLRTCRAAARRSCARHRGTLRSRRPPAGCISSSASRRCARRGSSGPDALRRFPRSRARRRALGGPSHRRRRNAVRSNAKYVSPSRDAPRRNDACSPWKLVEQRRLDRESLGCGHDLGELRRPVDVAPALEAHLTVSDEARDPVAVKLDLVQPLVARRRPLDERRQLGPILWKARQYADSRPRRTGLRV